jgi:hypothetical protein
MRSYIKIKKGHAPTVKEYAIPITREISNSFHLNTNRTWLNESP